MKKIGFILLFSLYSFLFFSQEIEKIEICAIEYDAAFYMPPLVNRIPEIGFCIRTTNGDIYSSDIARNIENLERRPCYPVDSLHIEGNTRAIVTLTYEDGVVNTLYLLGPPDSDIVWKGKKYTFYYPLAESVYYFYPERYFKKEANLRHYRRLEDGEE